MDNEQGKTIYIETYGCSANQNNSEILSGILNHAGFIVTNNPAIAQIIIINTCIVKEKTESKIKKRIQDLKGEKDKIIIVTGCMPQTDAKKLKKLNEKIILLGTHHFKEILNIIRDYKENKLDWKKQEEYLSDKNEIKLKLPKKPISQITSIHQISEGCLGNCTYCKTKLAKGKLFSYPIEEILKSIENDLQNGAKEIWLTSQDNAVYGLDKEKENKLPELLEKILELKQKFKLRLGMSNPNNTLPIIKELLEVYKNPKIYKFLHIPIQSASNSVLKSMNRYYKIEDAEKIINEFKKNFPDIVIATDIIVGYPTETEEDHKENLKFIDRYKPDVLNLSKFSSHKQTEAGKLKTLQNSVIKKRTSELMELHRKTAQENKQKYKNKEIKVFVNKKISNDFYEARDENYNIILVKCSKEFLGKGIKVSIEEIGVHHMVGKLLTS
jgi:MiaB-like tRNA modifying enzyme